MAPEEDVREALKLVSRVAEIVKPRERISVLEDTPDNRILECAVAGKADIVVSGDRHLLDLRSFRGIPIVRLADFIRTFPTSPRARESSRDRVGRRSRPRPSHR